MRSTFGKSNINPPFGLRSDRRALGLKRLQLSWGEQRDYVKAKTKNDGYWTKTKTR